MLSKTKLAALISTVACAISLASTAASAQTTANGPYYATPSWDQKLQCDSLSTCPRLVVLTNWNSEAVLDRETGLVWQRTPLSRATFPDAFRRCIDSVTGGRAGWRLPTIFELKTLIDPATGNLPLGHPFINVANLPRNPFTSYLYWSTTTDPTYGVPLVLETYYNLVGADSRSSPNFVWCVRGGVDAGNP
jgi:hypothetical protein